MQELFYSIGEQVDLLRTIDDSEDYYSGVIVAIDVSDPDYPYQVEIDQTGRKYRVAENDIEAQPTATQVRQFAALVDRVYQKLITHERMSTTNNDSLLPSSPDSV